MVSIEPLRPFCHTPVSPAGRRCPPMRADARRTFPRGIQAEAFSRYDVEARRNLSPLAARSPTASRPPPPKRVVRTRS